MTFTYKQSNLLITPDGLFSSIWFDVSTPPYQPNNQQQRIKWKQELKDWIHVYEDALRQKFMMAPCNSKRGKIIHNKADRTYSIRVMFWFESRYPRRTPMDWCCTPETPRPFICNL